MVIKELATLRTACAIVFQDTDFVVRVTVFIIHKLSPFSMSCWKHRVALIMACIK